MNAPTVLAPAPARQPPLLVAEVPVPREEEEAASPAARPARAAPPAPEPAADWAICCSGGGIRSATYCLGGLQSLDEGGLLGKAAWIVGVSGGSYIAASRALVAHDLGRAVAGQGRPAYARGTAEEEHLRNNTHYLAPDAKTVLVGVLSLLFGATITCVVALAPLYAASHAWGWLLRAQGVLTWSRGSAQASVTAVAWWAAPAAAAVVTLALFVCWWATVASGAPGRGARRARWVGWSAAVTGGASLLMIAVPLVVAWLSHRTGALGTAVRFFGLSGSAHWSLAALAGLITAMAAVARACQKQLARLRLPGNGPAAGAAAKLAGWARAKLTPWIASAVIVAAGAFTALVWTATAARAGYSPGQLAGALGAVAVVIAVRAVVDVNRTSLHDFYRWRLADAYAVTRKAAESKKPAARAKLLAKAARTRLSDLRGAPNLVIACTANINADRAVPVGRGGFCLAFDPHKVTLRGDPRAGEPEVRAKTKDYEHLLGHTRFTLFDVVAISGAAFSPLMGSATRAAYRIVLTLTNMRLGIWMPHPAVVRRARKYLKTPPGQRRDDSWWARRTWLLLVWYAARKEFLRRDAGLRKRDEDREARLWAHVLRLREQSNEARGSRQALVRLRAAVCWRMMQPTLGLLWAEAAGHTSYRATWINVTDGGHYDNLGLVEALRRGARNVVVLDAGGDRPGTWFTLGGAMALARADAGVEISLDPTTMIRPSGNGTARTGLDGTARTGLDGTPRTGLDGAPRTGLDGTARTGLDGTAALGPGQVLRPWARGTFTRPGGDAASGHGPAAGNIWVCKLGWWEEAPWDIRAYAAGHPGYPSDTTLNQLYDGAEFEAYHELGASSVVAAATAGRLPLLLKPS